MKVLMFGWEFPPHISGGLGTACYGITKGLSKQGVEVLFVMPSASGDEDTSAAHIINASDVSFESTWTKVSEFFKNVKFLKVSSTLVPYVDPETFRNLTVEEMEERRVGYECGMRRSPYQDK